MELIPKVLVVGVFAPPQPGPERVVTEDKLNRIWSEVAPRQRYRQLQLAPDGSGAQFIGESPDHGATIQLPLIQVRYSIASTRLSADEAASEVQSTMKTIVKHLGVSQLFNLAVRHVYHVPIATNDAPGFVFNRLLEKSTDDLGMLQRGGPFFAGLKYWSRAVDGSEFVLSVEPFMADQRYLFLDLDAKFPGVTELDLVTKRAHDAEEFISHSVKSYLDTADGHGQNGG